MCWRQPDDQSKDTRRPNALSNHGRMHWTKNPDAKGSKWLQSKQREPPRLWPSSFIRLVRPSDEENFVEERWRPRVKPAEPWAKSTQTDNMNRLQWRCQQRTSTSLDIVSGLWCVLLSVAPGRNGKFHRGQTSRSFRRPTIERHAFVCMHPHVPLVLRSDGKQTR